MFRSRISVSAIAALILGFVMLCPIPASAQRHGGGGSSTLAGSGSLNAYSRPDGVDEKDILKDFHAVLAVQASSQQVAEFQALVKMTEAAQSALQSLLQRLHQENAAPQATSDDPLAKALENTRTSTRKFQEGFSPAQKSGLKDISKRLAKADSDLDQEDKRLEQSLAAKAANSEVAPVAESLGKALTDFYNQQLALGREMSITLASGQDLTFMLPQVKTPVRIANRTIPIAVSGRLTQTAAQGGQRKFKLELSADLSDLQENIFELLRTQLETSETCGQRITIRQARLTPATPASTLIVWLHFERWMCTRASAQQTANELAEGNGQVEIKLTAAINAGTDNDKNNAQAEPNTLTVTAALGRIDATGMMEESLRSGSLGEDLRDQITQSVLSAARAATDFKIVLPPVLQNSATLESAKFQDVGAGGLSVELDGQIEISNAQADQLANQLNQTLSAQTPPAQ
jgi:hypothetical protein